MRYCGRDFPPKEMALIRRLIADDPSRTRADLSRLLCARIGWYKVDGGLKEMSARVAMLRMQDDGLIRLPAPTCGRPQSRIRSTSATDPGVPIDQPVHTLPSLQLVPVVKRTQSRLWNEYIHRYHYLGYKTLPGAQLRYFVTAADQTLALLGFGAAAWQCAPRDRHIGWHSEQRARNLHLVVNKASAPAHAPYLHPCRQCPFPDTALGPVKKPRLQNPGLGRSLPARALAATLRLSPRAHGDLRRYRAIRRHLLQGR